MKEIEIICAYCGKPFMKRAAEIRRQQKKGRTEFFCSQSCGAKYKNASKKKPTIEKICPVCGASFTTTLKVKENKTFCSRSCASKGSVTEYRRSKAREMGAILTEKYRGNVHSVKRLMEVREADKNKLLKEFLENLNIPYEFEYILEGKLYDLAILNKNILIEFDGEDHKHSQGACFKNDSEKNAIAAAHGWDLIRIPVEANTIIQPELIRELL